MAGEIIPECRATSNLGDIIADTRATFRHQQMVIRPPGRLPGGRSAILQLHREAELETRVVDDEVPSAQPTGAKDQPRRSSFEYVTAFCSGIELESSNALVSHQIR